MDVLRARAFLDLVLSKDSRPGAEPTAKPSPGGFAGRATLTVPLATLLDLADRPGEIPCIGPIDPDPGANKLDCYQTGVSRPRYPAHKSTSPLPPQGSVTCARHVH